MPKALLPALAAAAIATAGCGKDKTADIPDGNETGSVAAAPTAPAASGDQCSNKATKGPKLDPGRDYTLTVKTNKGTFAIGLDQKKAPRTARSVVALAKKGFYNGLEFHRIAPDFVIQGGDPKGDGSGGPGYSTCDTPPPDAKYTEGVVAMAKTGQEEPGTAGSQFFVVTGRGGKNLTPDYAVLGKITKGDSVVQRIGKLGDQSEQPTEKVVIKSMKVAES